MTKATFIREPIARLSGYIPGEQPRDRSYTKLNTNENPYPPSERVLAVLRAAVGADLRLYPDPHALQLRRAASAVYGITSDHIMAGNGSDELLSVVLRACIDPGGTVAYAAPSYSLYDTLVALQGGVARRIAYPRDYRLPVEGLIEAAARVTILCNPNAPSGTLTPAETIEHLARSVAGLLVVDEAYVDFASETAIPLTELYPNVLVLRTFSKSFSLCGLRVGLAFANPSLIHELTKVRDSYSVNQLGLIAATAALEDYGYMLANAERIRSTRGALSTGLTRRGFEVLPSQTNFVLARRENVNLSDYQRKLKEQGVLVRHFATHELSDALRITVGTPEEMNNLFATMDILGTPA